MKISLAFFYMRYLLFLHYGWFLQNLGKDFIRTNMHTTVTHVRSRGQSIIEECQRLDYWVRYSILEGLVKFSVNKCLPHMLITKLYYVKSLKRKGFFFLQSLTKKKREHRCIVYRQRQFWDIDLVFGQTKNRNGWEGSNFIRHQQKCQQKLWIFLLTKNSKEHHP